MMLVKGRLNLLFILTIATLATGLTSEWTIVQSYPLWSATIIGAASVAVVSIYPSGHMLKIAILFRLLGESNGFILPSKVCDQINS